MTMLQISLPDDRYRRWVGFILGGLLGLAYGVVSQLINRVAAPGVPLYQPPYGAVGEHHVVHVGGRRTGHDLRLALGQAYRALPWPAQSAPSSSSLAALSTRGCQERL